MYYGLYDHLIQAMEESVTESPTTEDTRFSLNARQALSTFIFWRMLLIQVNELLDFEYPILCHFLQISISIILDFTGTYTKSFGQVYISDDAFLAAAATVQNVMNGTARC